MSPAESDIARDRPRIAEDRALRLLESHYGIAGEVLPLPSDRDRNVLVRARDGSRYVLKIAHALESRSILQAQNSAMEHAARAGLAVPRPLADAEGRTIVEAEGDDGRIHLARLLTYLPGVPLARVQPRHESILSDLGRFTGSLSTALSDFTDPALELDHVWDLARAEETVQARIDGLEPEERQLVEPFVETYRRVLDRVGARLPRRTVHNDVNDHNVLVDGPDRHPRRIVGLIDFGDALSSWRVSELAVATAYGVLGTDDPLRAAFAVVAGYSEVADLEDDEIAALYPLIAMRLCVSICMSAYQHRMEPENEYLMVSRTPALRLLARLKDIHPKLAEYTLRHACGLEPCPAGTAVARFCRSRRASFAPVVTPAPSDRDAISFDFGVDSADWSFEELTRPRAAGVRLFREMDERGARVGVGRYGEVRLVYRVDRYLTPSQARTVHLGVDLFQPPGSPVCAPLDGTVHSVADHAEALDYGPTVILHHRPEGGPPFYTLYGHLSRASVAGLAPGRAVRAGEAFAAIGREDENGGCAPHVHVQIVADLLGYVDDFPGVAAPWAREVWTAVSPEPSDLLGLSHAAAAAPRHDTGRLLDERAKHVGPSLCVAYEKPLVVARGRGAYLYDREGQAHLDTVNNVAHVGHGHPRVVDAVARQMTVLNTNTRYLYERLTEYAERLTATLPDPLRVCYFVNSGSEANDLALRLARAHTGRRGVVVVDQAYHGNLSSLIEISPYKFAGAGGSGRPPHVQVVPTPDPYRDGRPAAEHVAELEAALRRSEGGVGAFFVESAMGCAGQVFFPAGYLKGAFAAVRRAGGVCVADEVQTGFGRVGEAFWGFELQGVVPDVVTMGKPIGNGHPLGAVVTTPEIAASFDDGMEYFNTFGGNPASCAAGLAVLEVIREERLQEHARVVGARLKAGLAELSSRHEAIGDVRGSGLFLGVDLVADRTTKEPASRAAAYVVERMRERGILTSRDGPAQNVLKIKPPLVFGAEEADRYVETLGEVLAEDFVHAAVGGF